MKTAANAVLRTTSLALAIALAAAFLLGGCFTLTRPALPQVRGSVVVEGLNDRVEIHRDRVGVAHIIATNEADAFYAQGYVHAQDRFYQMEFWRRIGAGRLSELFGAAVLPSDIYLRTMGFRITAEAEYAAAPPLLKNALDAYAAGVNAYIAERTPRKLAAEFALLGLQGLKLEIEPWTPADSLTWPKVMSQDMGADYIQELLRLDIIRAVGVDMARGFFGSFRYDQIPTVIRAADLPEGRLGGGAPTLDEDLALLDDPRWLAAVDALERSSRVFEGRELLAELAFGGSFDTGTNMWVVSGTHTESGLPHFANDPHLGIQMPSIWYQCSLHVSGPGGWTVHGFSFAGLPGIIIGHNDSIIWGMATAEPDVQDLYVEQVNPLNPDQYLVGDQWVDMEIRHEVIRVKGRDPVFLRVRSTRNGPIVTDHGGAAPYASYDVRPVEIFPTDLVMTELSLRWTALDQTFPLYAVLLHNRARNFDEFREALSHFHTPSHNFLYADVHGNIGYVHPGRIPVRGKGAGSLPAPGWDDAYQWQGYVPYEELPWLLNPDRGYIISTNNPVMPDGSQVFGEHLYLASFRAARAETLLTEVIARGAVTADDHVAMQLDTFNEFAERLLPYVLTLGEPAIRTAVANEVTLLAPPAGTEEKRADLAKEIDKQAAGALAALDMLRAWDRRMETDRIGATVFARFYVELCDRIFADQLPAAVWDGPWKTTSGYRVSNSVWLLLEDPANRWWDDARTPEVVETRDEILARALAGAFASLEEELGSNTRKWEWGKVHTATFQNATLGKSGISLIENIFNRGPVTVAGGGDVLRRADFRILEPFDVYHIASLRMVADLADWSSARFVHGPGQSGHPASRHYDNLLPLWVEGRYYTRPWTLDEIRASSRRRLVLEPGK